MSKLNATIPEEKNPVAEGAVEVPMADIDDTAETAVTIRNSGSTGMVTGAITQRDIPMPVLSIAYGVGELATRFSPGDLILDREYMLVQKTQPLNVVVISANVYWKEYLDQAAFQAGLKARIFNTEEEVLASGGTIGYGPNGERPTFKRAMTLKMLIEKPANVTCMLFAWDINGKSYAPAVWYVDKTAYQRGKGRGVGLEIVKQASFALKQRSLLAGKWQITTAYEEVGTNKVIAPSIRLVGQHTDEEIEAIRAKIGA